MNNKLILLGLILIISLPFVSSQILQDNYVSELIIIKGNIKEGSINDTKQPDNVSLLLAETTGAPGFQYLLYFENVEGITPSLEYKYRYLAGGGSHIVNLLIYDFDLDQFVLLDVVQIDDAWQIGEFDISSVGRGSSIILKFDHPDPGNNNHEFEIDYLNVKSITPIVESTETTLFDVELENSVYITMIIIMLSIGLILALTTNYNAIGSLIILITGFIIITNTNLIFGLIIIMLSIILIFKTENNQ